MRRPRPAQWAVGVTSVALFVIVAVLVGYRIPLSSERLRREVTATLSERLRSEVELGALELHLFPRIRIVGRDLTIRHRTHPEVRLIQVQQFTAAGDLVGLLRKHVAHVRLDGLAIQIPPRDEDGADTAPAGGSTDDGTTARQLVIDELVADGATLTLIPRESHKRPKVWRLHELRLERVGLEHAMPFHGILTNAVPPGTIDTTGSFGPWNADRPGLTPIDGDFTFARADLSVFKGIGGVLAAHGSYEGSLGQLAVSGKTTTPDFTVSAGGHPVSLATTYRATVDGTNGNTTLDRIDAAFLDTAIVASGGVYDVPDGDGRFVTLDVRIERGRLEDVLRLAVPTPDPTMTGGLTLQTTFNLPPGDRSVVDKLQLDGSFAITAGRFTDATVQQKINALSGRARTDEGDGGAVTSDFTGRFTLADGQLALDPLRFTIPGALVDVRGEYALRSGALSFAGQLVMEARVSQAMDGWKALLLKPFDPLFRKDGQTLIPLTIAGTRADPKFGIDVKRVFNKDAPAVPPGRRPADRRSGRQG